MDFTDTPEEAAFRAEVRAFLAANAELRRDEQRVYPVRQGDDRLVPLAKDWQKRKEAAKMAGITWAQEYGGRGLSQIYQVIYNQEESKYLVPRGVFEIGLGMCLPTMMTFSKPSDQERFVGPALRGEEVWCQLFSEPAGGSDVAGLRTRAVKDGDDWVINGQKIWTSGAHFSDWGIIVVRTDPGAPKHKGLSFFFLNMKSPGITVKRIKQIAGVSNFNEVFFDNVRVPDAQRLGAVGEGWKVAIATLMNERLAVGDTPPPDFDEIFQLCRTLELEEGPAIRNAKVRDQLADWYVQQQGLKYAKFRTMTALSRGQTPGPESSITKIVSANKRQQIAHFAIDLMEGAGPVSDPATAPMKAMMQEALMSSPGSRIAGGTDEILRNIIAERILGLPQDVRVDKDISFEKLAAQGR